MTPLPAVGHRTASLASIQESRLLDQAWPGRAPASTQTFYMADPMIKSSQFLRISSKFIGFALGTSSLAFAIIFEQNLANAIPVSLNRKQEPAPKQKQSINIANTDVGLPKTTSLKKRVDK